MNAQNKSPSGGTEDEPLSIVSVHVIADEKLTAFLELESVIRACGDCA
jgi:hypothetical protein